MAAASPRPSDPSVSSTPAQREHRPEQERAIASQHDRELPVVKDRFYLIGQQSRIVVQWLRVQHLGPRIGHAAVTARRKAACPACIETVGQAGFEQDSRRALHAEVLRDVP
jgi:hypothetical protein